MAEDLKKFHEKVESNDKKFIEKSKNMDHKLKQLIVPDKKK